MRNICDNAEEAQSLPSSAVALVASGHILIEENRPMPDASAGRGPCRADLC